MGDKAKGFVEKFRVERVNGTSAKGEKHHDCNHLVLDLTPGHDPHAIPAAIAYAESVRKDGYELLANDIMAKVGRRNHAESES